MSMKLRAQKPTALWEGINLCFIGDRGDEYVDENTGISVQSFDNRFVVEDWDPSSDGKLLRRNMGRMGYSSDGTKLTQLWNKYVDVSQLEAFKVALKEYRDKERFTLGMTFKNQPARKGGCLTGFQIVKYGKKERCYIYAKIVEVPKKFAADLVLFNDLMDGFNFAGKVTIVPTCVFFWKVTAPLLLPVLGLESFRHAGFRSHVLRKIRDRAYLASGEYKYRNEARTWEYLKPIIDRMIEEGELHE